MWTDARTAEVESGGARGERRVGRQVLERAAHTAVEIGARGPVRERTARQATAELAHWLQWRGKLARSNRIDTNRIGRMERSGRGEESRPEEYSTRMCAPTRSSRRTRWRSSCHSRDAATR